MQQKTEIIEYRGQRFRLIVAGLLVAVDESENWARILNTPGSVVVADKNDGLHEHKYCGAIVRADTLPEALKDIETKLTAAADRLVDSLEAQKADQRRRIAELLAERPFASFAGEGVRHDVVILQPGDPRSLTRGLFKSVEAPVVWIHGTYESLGGREACNVYFHQEDLLNGQVWGNKVCAKDYRGEERTVIFYVEKEQHELTPG